MPTGWKRGVNYWPNQLRNSVRTSGKGFNLYPDQYRPDLQQLVAGRTAIWAHSAPIPTTGGLQRVSETEGACVDTSKVSNFDATMTATETQLVKALHARLTIIADEASRRDPERHMQRLKEAHEEINSLANQLPRPLHPQLAHFLARGSYEKALELLETM